MKQLRFIITDELFLLQHVRLQAMSDVVYLIFCNEESLKQLIIHNGDQTAPNNTLQPSLKNAASIRHFLTLFISALTYGRFSGRLSFEVRRGEVTELIL